MAESFNLLNRDNQRVQITQDGFSATQPSLFRPIKPLESISSRLNTASHPAFCKPPTPMLRGRFNSL